MGQEPVAGARGMPGYGSVCLHTLFCCKTSLLLPNKRPGMGNKYPVMAVNSELGFSAHKIRKMRVNYGAVRPKPRSRALLWPSFVYFSLLTADLTGNGRRRLIRPGLPPSPRSVADFALRRPHLIVSKWPTSPRGFARLGVDI